MEKELKGEVILCDGSSRTFAVSYYMLSDVIRGIFGIAVEKKDRKQYHMEYEEIKAVAESPEMAENLIRHLMFYQVTPISLMESLDEILSKEEFCGTT